MTSNQLKAVAKGEVQNPTASFKNYLEKNKEQIAAALPSHLKPDRMIRLALTEFSKNPTLQKCTPVSIFGSIVQASQLGLEIGVLGQAYLVPYYNKKAQQYQAQLIPGYKGLIALARRSGEVDSIQTHIVYMNDEFDLELGLVPKLVHKPNLIGDRGQPRLVYGVAHFKDGGHHFEWMAIGEVERIRSRSQAAQSGPWVTDYDQMVRKTLIRRMANYLPMSIEMIQAIQLGDAGEAGKRATIEGDVVVVHDDDTGGPGEPAPDPFASTPDEEHHQQQKTPAAPKQTTMEGAFDGPNEAFIMKQMDEAKTLDDLDVAPGLAQALSEEARARVLARYREMREKFDLPK